MKNISSNTLEDYCKNPFDGSSISLMRYRLAKRAKSLSVVRRIFLSVLFLMVLLSIISSVYFNGFIWIASCIVLLFVILMGGILADEYYSVEKYVSLRLFGEEMIVSDEDLDDESSIASLDLSPLASLLVEGVNAQGRKLLSFEAKIIKRLMAV